MGVRDFNFWNAIWVDFKLYLKRIYCFYTRYPPFYDNEPIGIYKKIVTGIIEFPRFFDLKAKDLIRKLLNPDLN